MHTTTCTLCRLPISPGQPAATAAALDVADGKIILGAPRRYHIGSGCRTARSAELRSAAA